MRSWSDHDVSFVALALAAASSGVMCCPTYCMQTPVERQRQRCVLLAKPVRKRAQCVQQLIELGRWVHRSTCCRSNIFFKPGMRRKGLAVRQLEPQRTSEYRAGLLRDISSSLKYEPSRSSCCMCLSRLSQHNSGPSKVTLVGVSFSSSRGTLLSDLCKLAFVSPPACFAHLPRPRTA